MAYGQSLKAEWDRQFRVIVAGLVLIVLIIMGGVALLTSTPDQVSTVTGVVRVVQGDQSGLCMVLDGGDDDLCAGLQLAANAPAPVTGDHIQATVVRVPLDAGDPGSIRAIVAWFPAG
jgi:hypothetical protein